MLALRTNFLRRQPQNFIGTRQFALNRIAKANTGKPDEDDEDTSADEFKKFKAKQLEFQRDDGVPIHLKGGKRDRFFYYLTLGLVGFGLLNTFEYIFYSALSERAKKKYDDFWTFK